MEGGRTGCSRGYGQVFFFLSCYSDGPAELTNAQRIIAEKRHVVCACLIMCTCVMVCGVAAADQEGVGPPRLQQRLHSAIHDSGGKPRLTKLPIHVLDSPSSLQIIPPPCLPYAVALQVYAFLAEHYSRPLARVLFWAGAGPMLLLAIIIVGEWLARLRHDGHVNGAWQASCACSAAFFLPSR